MKKKALVVGSHVSESLSPIIFNYWFKKYKINASYSFKEIKPQNFEEEIKYIFADESLAGFNITIPFKELIINKVDSLNKHSFKIGAVNCVSKVKNKWVGKNTDWSGFYKSIEGAVKKNNLQTAIVLGYGGASKGVLYALENLNFKTINIYNRTQNKIRHLVGKKGYIVLDESDLEKKLYTSDIIINTTPTNIINNMLTDTKPIDAPACDIVYRPKETEFLSCFTKNKRIYGISMLINQAAPCFEEWFGVKPVADEGLFRVLDRYQA